MIRDPSEAALLHEEVRIAEAEDARAAEVLALAARATPRTDGDCGAHDFEIIDTGESKPPRRYAVRGRTGTRDPMTELRALVNDHLSGDPSGIRAHALLDRIDAQAVTWREALQAAVDAQEAEEEVCADDTGQPIICAECHEPMRVGEGGWTPFPDGARHVHACEGRYFQRELAATEAMLAKTREALAATEAREAELREVLSVEMLPVLAGLALRDDEPTAIVQATERKLALLRDVLAGPQDRTVLDAMLSAERKVAYRSMEAAVDVALQTTACDLAEGKTLHEAVLAKIRAVLASERAKTAAAEARADGILAQLRDTQDAAEEGVLDFNGRRLVWRYSDGLQVVNVRRVTACSVDTRDGGLTGEDLIWLAGDSTPARLREEHGHWEAVARAMLDAARERAKAHAAGPGTRNTCEEEAAADDVAEAVEAAFKEPTP